MEEMNPRAAFDAIAAKAQEVIPADDSHMGFSLARAYLGLWEEECREHGADAKSIWAGYWFALQTIGQAMHALGIQYGDIVTVLVSASNILAEAARQIATTGGILPCDDEKAESLILHADLLLAERKAQLNGE